MRKTIFLAVALSILLCATAIADDVQKSTGQKITIPFLMGKYASGQTMQTRIHILNNDPLSLISVVSATLIAPNGEAVFFNCDEDGNEVKIPSSNLVDLHGTGVTIPLVPYASASINVNQNMLRCSDWDYSPLDDGWIILNGDYLDRGRPMIELTWGTKEKVVPPEVWAFFRLRLADGSRESFDRWDGRVIEEY